MLHHPGPRPTCDDCVAACDIDDCDPAEGGMSDPQGGVPVVSLRELGAEGGMHVLEGCLPKGFAGPWALPLKAADPERELSLASRASTRQDSVAPRGHHLVQQSRPQEPPRPSQCQLCWAKFPSRNALFRHLDDCRAEQKRKAERAERRKWQDLQRARSPERSRAPSRARVNGPGAPIGVRAASLSLARPRERSSTGDGEWSDGREDGNKNARDDGDEYAGDKASHESTTIVMLPTMPQNPVSLPRPSEPIAVACGDQRLEARSCEAHRLAEVGASRFIREVAGSPPNDNFELCRTEGEGPASIRFADRAHFSLGRSSQAGVTITSLAFSRFHLQLVHNKIDGQAYIIDLRSSNGTVLNGERLRSGVPHQVRLGDTVCVGSDAGTRVRYAVSATFLESTVMKIVNNSIQPGIDQGAAVHSSATFGVHDGSKVRNAVQITRDAKCAEMQRAHSSTISSASTEEQMKAAIQPADAERSSLVSQTAAVLDEKEQAKSSQMVLTTKEVVERGPLCACGSGKFFSDCHQPLVKKRQLAKAARVDAMRNAKRSKIEKMPEQDCLQTNVPDSTGVEKSRGKELEGPVQEALVSQVCADCRSSRKRCPHFKQEDPRVAQTPSETPFDHNQEQEIVEEKHCEDSASNDASAGFQEPVAVPLPAQGEQAGSHPESRQEPIKTLLTAEEKVASDASCLSTLSAPGFNQGTLKAESDLGEDLIGWRVKVYWEGEATWFSGYVIDVFIGRKKARKPSIKVLYDDGDIQDEKMKDIRWIAKVEEPEGDAVVGWRVKCLRESDNAWLPAIVTDSISEDEVQVMFQDGEVLKELREEVLWISAPVRIGSKAKREPKTLACNAQPLASPSPVMMAALPASSDLIGAPPTAPACLPAVNQDSAAATQRRSSILPHDIGMGYVEGTTSAVSTVLAAKNAEDLPMKDKMSSISDVCSKKPMEGVTKHDTSTPTVTTSSADSIERRISHEQAPKSEISLDVPESEPMDAGARVTATAAEVAEKTLPQGDSKAPVKLTHKRKLEQAAVADAGEDGECAKNDQCNFKDKCYDCKFGQFARRKNSPKQCRSIPGSGVKGGMGHTACDWQDDPRTKSQRSDHERPEKAIKTRMDASESMPRSAAGGRVFPSERTPQRSDLTQSPCASPAMTQATAPQQHQASLGDCDVSEAGDAGTGFLGGLLEDDGGDCRDELNSMLQDVSNVGTSLGNGGASYGEESSILPESSALQNDTQGASNACRDEANQACFAGFDEGCATPIDEPSNANDADGQGEAGVCASVGDAFFAPASPVDDNFEPSNLMGRLEWLMGVQL